MKEAIISLQQLDCLFRKSNMCFGRDAMRPEKTRETKRDRRKFKLLAMGEARHKQDRARALKAEYPGSVWERTSPS